MSTSVHDLQISDLQKLSEEGIGALPGPTQVKSGDRTVGLLVPFNAADSERLAAVLARAEALDKESRDMSALLEEALAKVARLPEAEQQAIATLILDEIAAERSWDERFAGTQDQLGVLVRSARAEVARGDVVSGDPSDRPAK
jgi:hypothetical protein